MRKLFDEYSITAEGAFRSACLANNDHDPHRAARDTRDAMTLLDGFVRNFGPEVNAVQEHTVALEQAIERNKIDARNAVKRLIKTVSE